jgi:hypothetical protein
MVPPVSGETGSVDRTTATTGAVLQMGVQETIASD